MPDAPHSCLLGHVSFMDSQSIHFLLHSERNCLLTNPSLTLDCDLPEGWETVAFFSVPSVPTQCLACTRHSRSIYWNEWLNKWTCFDYMSSNKTKDLSSFSSVLWEQMYSSYVTQSLGWMGEDESPRGCAGRGVSRRGVSIQRIWLQEGPAAQMRRIPITASDCLS